MKKIAKPITLSINALLLLGLSACDSVDNQDAPPQARSRAAIAQDTEVTYFQQTLYANVLRAQQCRDCHVTGGAGNGAFADDNVNTAYSAAISRFNPGDIATLDPNDDTPLQGNVFVTKVQGGHYCWVSDCDVAAQAIVDELRAWWNALNSGGTVEDNTLPAATPVDILDDPPVKTPKAPVTFDGDVEKFNAVYQIVTDPAQGNCGRCHSTTTDNTPQRPFFAETSQIDPTGAKTFAYNEVVSYGIVNLTTPAQSKLVVRPYPGLHNCGSDCEGLAADIRAAITTWSDAVRDPNAVFNPDNELLPSNALALGDGQVTSGGARYDDYVIAKYEFKEGSDGDSTNDNIARDSSGVEPAIDLRLFGNVRWVGGYGIEIGAGGQARSISTAQSQKLHDLIVARGEYSIEAWVIPDNTSQEGDTNIDSTVIVSYSSGTLNRNATLGQDAYQYRYRNRVVDANGSVLETPMGENVVQTSLQHVVATYTAAEGRKIYVNGVPVVCETAVALDGTNYMTACPSVDDSEKDNAQLTQWDPGYLLTLGSDTNGANQWLGKIKFAALHRKALTEREININYDAGVGQKFNLLFNVSDFKNSGQWDANMTLGDRSYIWFEVAEYDDYSYMFSEPKFIDLDYTDQTGRPAINFGFRGMRIGINGKEVAVGQAYTRLGKFENKDPNDTGPDYLEISGYEAVSLARLQGLRNGGITPATGTVLPKDIDVDTDEFFLTFEWIGGITEGTTRAGERLTLNPVYDSTNVAFVVGVRTFDELNATMAALTGVNAGAIAYDDPNNDALKGYTTLKGQLPASEAVTAFAASQQTAIASLAGRYCDKRIEGNPNDPAVIADGQTAEEYFGVDQVAGFSFASSTASNVFASGTATGGNIEIIADAIIQNMVRNVGTLGDGDLDPLNNVIKPEVMSLAAYLVGEITAVDDPSTAMPTPHECGVEIPDCDSNVRMKSIVKAMCTAVLASAVITHQ